MSERDTFLLLSDIRSSISNIMEFTKGITFEVYEADLRTKHAVERNFEIIGESVQEYLIFSKRLIHRWNGEF